MSKLHAALALCLCASVAHADDSIETIARAALQACASMPDSKRVEYGGAILKGEHGYRVTEPVRGSDHDVAYTFALHRGETIVALYHSHTGTQTIDEYFSWRDVQNADQLNVPSYIVIPGRANAVHLYQPHTAHDKTLGARLAALTVPAV